MIALLLALLIGASLVLLGAGGSIVTMPVLVYAAGLDVHRAAGTSLLVVGLVAFAGAAAKWRQIRLGTALAFGAAGTAGALPGAWLNHTVPDPVVLAGFAATALVAAWQMLRSNGVEGSRQTLDGRGLGMVLLSGLGLGVVTGFFGVGGGFLIVPALTLIAGLGMESATATSLLIIGINSVAGLIGHAGFGAVEWRIGAEFTAAALLGGALALPLARRLSGPRLQRVFAVVLVIVGVGILVHSIGQWLA